MNRLTLTESQMDALYASIQTEITRSYHAKNKVRNSTAIALWHDVHAQHAKAMDVATIFTQDYIKDNVKGWEL